jgi:hypothetical protein
MRKLRLVKTDFTAGELDPLLLAREDIKAYGKGVAALRNFTQLDSGAIRRRPGSKYLDELVDGTILKPFSFGQGQDYVFAFSDERADIYNASTEVFADDLTSAPWQDSYLSRLYTAQSADTMIVCHPDMPMDKILRTGAATFTRAAYAFEDNQAGTIRYQPYYKFVDAAITLTPSATTGAGITLTLSGAGGFVTGASGHSGTIIRYEGKEILVTAVASATSATGTVRNTLPATTASTNWDEQVFSTVRGYANTAIFHEGRLWFCGTKSLPSHVFGSKVDAYFNFDLGTGLDDESIQVAIRSEQIGEIRGVASNRHLQLFTDTGEFFVPSSETRPLTPETFSVRVQQRYGSGFVTPQPFDGATLYVQKGGKALREFLYSDTDAAYGSNAVSVLAPHLISGPVDMTVLYGSDTRPEQYAYIVNDDGTMAQFHSIRSEQVAGFALWSTEGDYKSVCAVGGKVFVAVDRTIDAVEVRALEVFEDDRTLDCSLDDTSGAATVTFGAAVPHLEGEDVQVISGNLYLGEFTVAATGTVVVDDEVTSITAGLDYTPSFTTLPAASALNDGSLLGEIKRLVKCVLVLNETVSCMIGSQRLIIRTVGQDQSEDPEPFTGKKEFALKGFSRDAQITVEQDVPLMLTILGFNLEIAV